MCQDFAWNPINLAVAKRARVRAAEVIAVRAALIEVAGRAANPGDIADFDAEGWSLLLRIRQDRIEAILAACEAKGIIVAGRLSGWVTRDVTASRRAKSGAERTRNWRARRKSPILGDAQPVDIGQCVTKRDGNVTASQAPSLSLFPESEREKENKQTRARSDAGDDNGFAELARMWPLQNRMLDAEREYRRALKLVDRSRLIELAQRYLDELGTRYCMFLANWLHTQPWRDPLLPLASRPVEVVQVEPREPRIEWRSHAESWLARGIWPPDIGPPPDDPECRMPEGLHQTTLQRARRQHERERVYG